MPKPFKFRYVNEITGSFVLLVIGLLVAGVIAAGHAQGWFEKVYRVQLQFPPEGSLDLQKGSEVRILGARVGAVEAIEVKDDGSMVGNLAIRGNLFRFVRQDSQVIVKKKFGLAGDAYVDITKGQGPAALDGATFPCKKDTEIAEAIQAVVKQIQENTVPLLQKVQKAVDEYAGLAADLRNPQGQLQQILGHVNQIAAGLEKGEGPAGKVLRDPAMAQDLAKATTQLNAALDTVRQILTDVQRTTGKLPRMADTLGGEVQDLPGLVLQTQDTLRETTRLIEGIQRHWLMRKYVEQAGEPSERIAPSQVGGAAGGAR